MSNSLPPTFVPGFHNENIIEKMRYKKLGDTDLIVSSLSIGIAGFSYFYGDYDTDECRETLLEGLKSGINLIDAGPWYGHGEAEKILGQCLKGIPRKAYYLTTKVGRYEKDPRKMFDFSRERTRKSVHESLQRIEVDYFDLIQVHDVEFAPSSDYVIDETLPVLENFIKTGIAKYVGITGYALQPLAEIAKRSKISSVLSYARFNLIDTTLKDYIPLFQSQGLGIINASPTAMGLLTNAGPQSWHPASDDIKNVCSLAANYCKENGVELAKLAFDFAFREEDTATVLCSINNRSLLRENLHVLTNGLTTKEIEILNYVKKNFFAKLKCSHWEGLETKKNTNK